MERKKRIFALLVCTAVILNLFSLNTLAGVLNTNNNTKEESAIINVDRALTEFMKYGKPMLIYVRPWNSLDDGENRKLKLIYSLVNGPYFYFDFNGIDAVTAVPVSSSGKELKLHYEKIGDKSNELINKRAENLKTPLSAEEALIIAKREAVKYNQDIPNNLNYKLNINENWLGLKKRVYAISWVSKIEGANYSFKIIIDSLSGKVVEISYHDNTPRVEDDSKTQLSWLSGKDKAVEFLKGKFPEFVGSVVLMQSEPDTRDKSKNFYYYSFWRSVKGILYPENNVNIIVDNQDGTIIGYGYRWEFIDFPEAGPDIISEAQASQIFINKIGIKLKNRQYMVVPNGAAYIDAYTGQLKDSKGNDIERN